MEAKKIMIVDDDIDVINMLSAILKKENYQVFAAENKQEALALAKKEKPDMAILDVMMTTHYEGFELAQDLKKDPAFNNIPVLMQTSIEVLITTKASVQEMAHEYRKDPNYKELQVILLKDVNTGAAGIDYLTEDGRTVWIPVDGFIAKPVDAGRLIPEVKRLLKQ